MSATTRRVADLVAPVAERLGLSVYDVEQAGGTLRVLLDREGGVDVDTLADATREISRLLDETEPVAGSYTLEVSSPGLERPLRTASHFAAAVGREVKVKLMPGTEGSRRADGLLVGVDGTSFTVATDEGERTLDVAEVSRAHTVFHWESGAPKPGSPRRGPRGVRAGAAARASAEPTPESNEDHP